MSIPQLHQSVVAPTSVWLKPVTFDIRGVLRALAKVAAHSAVGKWADAAIDTSELITATGIKTEPAELAWLLVSRATLAALVDLIRETAPTLNVGAEEVELEFADGLSDALVAASPELRPDFFRDPGAAVFLPHVEAALERWLVSHGVGADTATVISARLRAHFVFHLNREWQRGDKLYAPISVAVDTPFTKATARETAWAVYRSALNRHVDEALFDEPFGLRQVYVPLRGYFIDEPQIFAKSLHETSRRVIVGLEREIDGWLSARNRDDAIRLLSGGPGSGKSSFARIYAAKLAHGSTQRVLFIPLHQFDPAGDLETSVGEFVRTSAILPYNPLAPDEGDSNLLVIFDGLDELALQGKLAGDVAVAFVREIQRQVALRNHATARLQVLITGRELVVQTHATEFRKRGAVLHVLPYYVPPQKHASWRETVDVDADGLLRADQRDEWWRKYGAVSGRGFLAMPQELRRESIDDITAQPLLNYLVALSFTRGEVDFSAAVNLNTIYRDLIEAVHERAYAGQTHRAIRGMERSQFVRVMEEIGLAAWHGDGRTTTVREIEEHCGNSGLEPLLEVFQEGAKAGVTRLLTAFYFRQHGSRRDGERTFEFTHKSFGEYLIACRIVRALEVILEETNRRQSNVDRGWSERDALRHWLSVCGPAPLDTYLATFVRNEIAIRFAEAASWQAILERLVTFALTSGLPIELLDPRPRFVDEQRLARNAEEALLVVLNAAARVTQRMSHVTWPERTAAGQWISRLQGQRQGPTNGLTMNSVSYMDFTECVFDLCDFYGADLRHSSFNGAEINYCNLMKANAVGARFENAKAYGTFFDEANLQGCNFAEAGLGQARFTNANLLHATMDGAQVSRSAAKEWIRLGAAVSTDEKDLHRTVTLTLSGTITRGPKKPRSDSVIEDAG